MAFSETLPGAVRRWRLPTWPAPERLLAFSRALASRPAAIVAGVAVVAAAWSVVASVAIFPHLSDNNDEAVYLLQAENLRGGNLFPHAPAPVESFRPWLHAIDGDRLIPKYTPVHAAMLAVGRTLTGSYRGALALLAAGTVLAGYLLAREVLGSRRQAALATGFLVASPVFLVQSATFLNYLPTLGVLMGFAAALLAGVRRQSPVLLGVSGLLLGIAGFSRPYDSLLFALPFAGWWAVGRRASWRTLVAEGRWLALGVAVPLLAMLAYFRAATGSFFETPFTLLHPDDIMGFGHRQMIDELPGTMYTPGKALLGVVRLSALSAFWIYGGLVLPFLCAAGIRHFRGSVSPWLALVGASVPLGYALFWGSYGSTQWGGPWRFGPFYWLPILAPASILAAAGFRRIWRWDRLVAGFAAASLALVSGYVVFNATRINGYYTGERTRLYAGPLQALELARQAPAVVFVPALQHDYLLQPFALARNSDFTGPVVWAIDRGEQANYQVLRNFPDRVPYLVVATGSHGAKAPSLNFTTSVQRLAVDGKRLVPAGAVD
jgi:hypothetical protein